MNNEEARDEDLGVPVEERQNWTSRWERGIEVFMSPDGVEMVRAVPFETPDLIATTTVGPIYLVNLATSARVKRLDRKERREARELNKRGLA